jgi:hypothetical protein
VRLTLSDVFVGGSEHEDDAELFKTSLVEPEREARCIDLESSSISIRYSQG